MVENENYKSYTANNGTELRFPKESVVQMTAEQRDCYQNFINVLAQILIKYAAAEKENQKRCDFYTKRNIYSYAIIDIWCRFRIQ